MQHSTLDWLRTARNLVKYAGADSSYGEGRTLPEVAQADLVLLFYWVGARAALLKR